jgi:hypothetical protein
MRTLQASHSTSSSKVRIKAENSFSATNSADKNAEKLAYISLNNQTPSPPRGAVPANPGTALEFFMALPHEL